MQQNRRNQLIFIVLCMGVIGSFLLSASYGAVPIHLQEMLSALQRWPSGLGETSLNESIFLNIRLPRAFLCLFVGAGLASGGALLQALLRNPIVEPGLIGVSSGAALGAATYFVLGAVLHLNAGEWTLPIVACLGGFLASGMVLMLSRSKSTGHQTIVGLLLTGIAVNAICMSGVGFLSYIARDPQARSITFWGMGALSGANWHSVGIVGGITIACLMCAAWYAKPLNALMLGTSEAMLLGVDLRRLRRNVLAINVLMVSVSTAFVGVIGFVGLITPHLLRMVQGSDNRHLLPNSALLGAILLSVADVAARMLVRPAELPIGIVTALIGAPVFVLLLRKTDYFF